jgi:phytoene dehydrogenase-like protein
MAEGKKVLIIGAGIAGLAAGCYAQMNGYESEIFELHDLPGGLCMAWERKGYWFDGCIHYLFGSGEGQPFNEVWQELGVLHNRPMINHESFMDVIGSNGRSLTVYADPDKLQAHLRDISPKDADLAEALCDGVRLFMEFDMAAMQRKPKDLMTLADWGELGQEMLPFAMPLAKWGPLSAAEFGEQFEDPFLRRAVPQMFGWSDIPMMAGLSLLAYMHKGNAGFPTGGSLAFAQAVEQRYLGLGGTIHYKAQVEKILVENDQAVGIRLYDDREFFGDVVVSCVDGQSTIFEMLGGEYTNRSLRKTYDGSMPILSQLQISLGVNRDLSADPHWAMYLLDEPMLITGTTYDCIGVKHYCFDSTLAPQGKSSVVVMLRTDYHYWQRIYDRKLYDMEQLQAVNLIIDFLETKYPGIREDIEVKDVATPVSYERYTGNHLGSTCGWLLTDKTMMKMIQGMKKTLPGLENFYMAGQWVEPGGSVPIVAMSGRNVVQMMCDKDKRPFHTMRG